MLTLNLLALIAAVLISSTDCILAACEPRSFCGVSSNNSASNYTEVVWTTDANCVAHQCRLENSATLNLLTSSCPRERCSSVELIPSDFKQLVSRPFALVVPYHNQQLIRTIIQYLDGIVDVFIVNTQENNGQARPYSLSGPLVDIYEFGKVKHSGLDLMKAVRRGTFGGIRQVKSGPIPKPSDVLQKRLVLNEGKIKETKRTLKECVRIIRRNSVGIRDEDINEYFRQMMRTCLVFADDDDDMNEGNSTAHDVASVDAVENGRAELWETALQLNLLPEGSLRSLSALEYRDKVLSEIESDTNREHQFWLAVSWVPVYEEYHEGLGNGERYEVLLLELVHVEPFSDIPDVSAVISTKGGKSMRVRHRRLLSLSACDDDELEPVLRCIRASIPNVFLFAHIVWGMGFAGDARYAEIESDWNADPVYYSGGEMPPKFEDIEVTNTDNNRGKGEGKDWIKVREEI